jgi:uncharacterized membrane protein
MTMTTIAVAIYNSHEEAEAAIKNLQRAGFDMKKLSIIGKDYHMEQHVVGYYNIGDRAKFFGKFGAFWGGLAGMLFGAAFLFVPVIGHIVILGPFASVLAGGIQGAVLGGGLSALAGALIGLGIPKDSVLRYETALKADKFLLVAHATGDELARARDILARTGPASLDQHSVEA